MSIQSIVTKTQNIYQFLNIKLATPVAAMQNKLAISLPLSSPVVFCGLMLMMFYAIINFANNFICNLIGIFYPLLFGSTIISNKNLFRNLTYNKYWMIFGAVILIDTFLGFILQSIPGYYYLKITFIYAMIRNNFELVDVTYDKVTTIKCQRFDPLIQKIINSIQNWSEWNMLVDHLKVDSSKEFVDTSIKLPSEILTTNTDTDTNKSANNDDINDNESVPNIF